MCDILFYEFYNKPDELYLPLTSPNTAWVMFKYAELIVRGRFLKGEPYIITDPFYATMYATRILKNIPNWPHPNGRWPEAEPHIMKSPQYSYFYVCYVLKERWLEAEPIMKTDAYAASQYAIYILKRRWKEAEPFIWGNHNHWLEYKRAVYND